MNKNNETKSICRKIRKISFNKKLRISLLIFLPIAIVAIACFLYLTMKNKYVDEKYTAYSYSNNSRINYDVLMLPNNLYDQKKLVEGGVYISDLIESINTRMTYEYSGNQKAKINGKYSITSLLEGYIDSENGEKLLFQKKNLIQPQKSFTINNNKVLLTSGSNINIKNYNEMVKNSIDLLKFNYTSKLKIIWSVNVDVQTKNGPVNETLESTMEIPINEKYFEIGGNLSSDKKGDIKLTRKVLSLYYKEKIIASCIGGVICLLTLLFIIFFTKMSPEMDPLTKKIRSIFKNHADRLVGVVYDIFSDGKEIVNVFKIEDLVRIADDLGKPILYKFNDKIEEFTNYFVLDDSCIFMLDIKKNILETPSNKLINSADTGLSS